MRTPTLAALLFVCSSVFAQSTPHYWELLIPGTYHHGEAPTKPGLGWLALTAIGGVWRLEPALIRVNRVHDAVLDGDADRTGIELTSDYANAIAFLRLRGVVPGKVDTPNMQFKDKYRPISRDAPPLRVVLKGREFSFDVAGTKAYLRSGRDATELEGVTAGDSESDDHVSLLWAGDLDRDGMLDVLLLFSGHNSGGVCLYLSGMAQSGSLVRQTACHGGIGC